jgi:hypothetical protein
MPLRHDDLQPPKILRAHRPRTPDTVQPLDTDEREVITQDLPKRHGLLATYWKHLLAGMCLMLGFYLLMTRLVLPFVTDTQQQWNYGYSRITEFDLNVGHDGTSHFICQYYKKQIVVIEMPVAHPEQSKIYALSETVVGDISQHVITLTATYVSRHPLPGKPDLVVSVSGFSLPVVLYNSGNGFTTEPH